MTSQTPGALSDSDLFNVSKEINRNQDEGLYWRLGIQLGFEIVFLVRILNESECNKLTASRTILGIWIDGLMDKANARNILAQTLLEMDCTRASEMIWRSDEYKSSNDTDPDLIGEEASTKSSHSITKSPITEVSPSYIDNETESDNDNQSSVSPVTSAAQSHLISVTKETKSYTDSVTSSRSSLAKATLAGILAEFSQLDLTSTDRKEESSKVPGQENEMRGAPGGDVPPDTVVGHTEALKLRDYQVELAKPAFPGHNTVVVAPTGTGKTYVAVAVAQEVLRRSGGKKKILFVVNKVPLVYQQSTIFMKYIERVTYVCGYHGTMPTVRRPLDILLREYEVVVLTSQILVDALKKCQISMNDIGLIILDECHETKKESPYMKIMERYMEHKTKRADGDLEREALNEHVPQILGLTSSLGVGNARTKTEAILYMANICSNLDARQIATVKTHRNCLAEVENRSAEETHVMPDREKDEFGEEVQSMMIDILKWIRVGPGNQVLSGIVDTLSTLARSIHASDRFSSILCDLNRQITESKWSPDQYHSLKTYANHLKIYRSSLDIHETARSKDALDYLRNQINQEVKMTETDNKLLDLFKGKEERLEQLSKSPSSNNPGLEKLQHLLKVAFSSRNGNQAVFRGLILTQTIASTEALKAWVLETPTLKDLNPAVLVGSRNRDMSERHQIEILDQFRQGVHKLLIATPVAEQRSDVPTCNFVFRYNYSSNAVGRIQARDHTPSRGGRFELVVHEYRRVRQKDQWRKDQEELMKQATEELSNFDIEEMKELIQQTRRFNQSLPRTTPSQPRTSDECDHEFRCKTCDKFACRSSSIRVVSGGHHVVVDDGILDRIAIGQSQKRCQQFGRVRHSGRELRCAECNAKWGSVMHCSHGALLAVSAEYFLVKSSQSAAKVYHKWAALPFVFKEAGLEEVALSRELLTDAQSNVQGI